MCSETVHWSIFRKFVLSLAKHVAILVVVWLISILAKQMHLSNSIRTSLRGITRNDKRVFQARFATYVTRRNECMDGVILCWLQKLR